MLKTLPKRLDEIIGGLLEIIYPTPCAGCTEGFPVEGGIFCVSCLAELSVTEGHLFRENLVTRHFWGRVPIHTGAAMLFLVPGGRTQKMIHEIKYAGKYDYARKIGEWYGKMLLESEHFKTIDLIMPVPLHWRKQQKRGFNQSEFFGRGLAASMKVPVQTKILRRLKNTSTQTRKTRFDRLDNMQDAFHVRKTETIAGKHVLIVDDVLTTGSTLEACALEILKVPDTKVSFACIAMGRI